MNDAHLLAKEYFRYHYPKESPRDQKQEQVDENNSVTGVAPNYVGHDPTINQYNREILRYHHWPTQKSYWSKAPHHTHEDGFRSEKGAIQFQNYDQYHGLNAPFGTMDTPTLSTKIIGSHYVPVIESYTKTQNPQGQSYAGQISITRLNDIPEKPNRVNPDLLKKKVRGYHVQQDHEVEPRQDKSSHGQPTYMGRQRPDSKSRERGHRVPALEHNRNKNKLSTVFEQEVGMPYGNPIVSDTEYTDKYHTEGLRPISDGHYRSMNGNPDESDYPKALSDIGAPVAQNLPPMSPVRHYQNGNVRNEDKDDLMRHLWNVGPDSIPQYPIQLSDKEEQMLKRLVIKELEGMPRRRLDTVHVEAITADREQNGTCPLITLKKSLERQGARLDSDTIRLVASKFVDPNQHGWIFYQDFVRYLKKVMKEHDMSVESKREYEAFQHRHASPMNELSALHHQPFGKLQQIAKQQLVSNNHQMNLAGIRRSLKEKDTPFRGKLSEDQIMHVLTDHNVPLQKTLITRLLNLKCKRVGDEQYDWQAFCDILETIQADATGLPMPTSKRPLDYARHLPEPTDQWPRQISQRATEPNHYEDGPTSYRQPSPTHQDHIRYSPRREPPYATQPYGQSNGPNVKFPPIRQTNTPLMSSRDIQEEIDKLENELRALQHRNEELLKQRSNDTRQLTGLCKDLYRIDEYKYGSSGRCHIKEAIAETEKRGMPIAREYLYEIADRCCNHKGMVDIDKYIKYLNKYMEDY